MLKGKNIAVGVAGSIAAYKALYLTRRLREAGAEVWPVMTRHAQRFVGPLSFAALAGRRPVVDLWAQAEGGEIGHVELAHRVDALVVAPASADLMARLAEGRADEPLTALALTCRAVRLLVPAMEHHMWEHPATQAHAQGLRAAGWHILEPHAGPLASGRQGHGRMAEPEDIVAYLHGLLGPKDLAGEHVVVTAGPTREALDPARFLSNPSTGKMGFALAQRALWRGAQVHLIAGPTQLTAPAGVQHTPIVTTDELLVACQAAVPTCTLLLMAAAPADFKPRETHPHKVKKTDTVPPLELVRTPDVLATLRARTPKRRVVGFAAETEKLLEHGAAKLLAKDLDMLVANDIGGKGTGFGTDTNAGWLLFRDRAPQALPLMDKGAMADAILDALSTLGGS